MFLGSKTEIKGEGKQSRTSDPMCVWELKIPTKLFHNVKATYEKHILNIRLLLFSVFEM